MKNALILHGTGSNSQGNWFPWLKDKLENLGYTVWVPDLPRSNEPNIERYNQYIFANKNWSFNKESILVGHSSGAVATLGLLQSLPNDQKVKACFLISAFKNDLGWDSLDGLFKKPFNYKKIRKKASKFILLHSDDDPYCPLFHAKYITRKLDGKLIVKKGQGHFNLEKNSEYKQFPFLLETIKKESK